MNINWQLFWTTFLGIFLAELGDKTQLSVLSFSATSQSPWTIFIAASLALISATSVGVLAGTFLSKFIHPQYLRILGGILFIAIGVWVLATKGD